MANSRIRGITIEIDGNTTKLQQALQQVNTSLGNTKSALGDVNRLLRFDPGSTELLRQKQTYLSQAIDETEEKLKQEKEALRQLEEAGKTTENQEQQRALKREIESTEQSLKSLKSQAAEAASVLGSRMQTAGQKMQSVGSKISGVGRNLSMYVTAPLVGVGAAVTKVTADFDEQMSKVQAISGAMGDDFDALRDKARELGMSSKYSAAEVGAGFEYMAMAGWKTEDMLQGIDGVLNLAAASGEELGTTSDIVTDALTAFGLSAKDSSHFADVLAAASTNANTNVSMLGESFKYAAPVAGALGISAEDTSVALGLMANAGIKASQAGTSLRTGLTNLSKPTKQMQEYMNKYNIALVQNEDGSVNLRQTMISLREKMGDLTTTEQAAAAAAIFGKDSMSGWLAIVNASEADFEKLTSSIDNCDGAAKSMAEIMQDNLNGELTKLKSALQEAGISLGESLVPMLRKAVTWIQGAVDKFNSLDESTKENIVKFGLFAAAVGPVMTAIGTMTSGVGGLVSNLGKVVTNVSAFSAGMDVIPWGPVGVGLAATAAAAILVKEGFEYIESAARESNAELYEAVDATNEATGAMESSGTSLKNAYDDANKSIGEAIAVSERATVLADDLAELTDAHRLTAEEQRKQEAIVRELNALYPDLGLEIDSTTGKLNKSSEEIKSFIENAGKMAQVQAYTKAIESVTTELADAYVAQAKAQYEADKAQQAVAGSMAEGVVQAKEMLQSGEKLTAWQKFSIGQTLAGSNAYTEEGQAAADASEALYKHSVADEELSKQTEEAEGFLAFLNEGLNELTGGAEESAEATEEAAEATGEYGDAAESVITALDQFGNTIDATTGEIVEYKDTATQAYMEAYSAAKQSIESQIGLFDTMSISAAHSQEEIANAMTSQANTYNQMAADMETAWNYAVQTGDTSTQQLIRQIAELGIEGSGDMAQLAQAIRDGNYDIVSSMSNLSSNANDAKDRCANILAQMQSNTVLTADGIKWSYDVMGQNVVTSLNNTGAQAQQAWSGQLNGLTGVTNGAMTGVNSAVNTGMNNVMWGINNASGGINVAASNAFGGVNAQANNAMSGLYWTGANGAANFANGIYGGGYNVSNAAWYLANTANDPLGNVTNNAYGWGMGLSQNFANGMWAKAQEVWNAAQTLANNVWSMMHHTTPEEGPLKDDDKWGAELAENFAAGMTAKAGLVQKAAGVLANAAVVQNLNSRNGFDISGAAGAGATVAGDDITFNIYASEGMNINQIADAVEQRLALVRRQKASAYA